MYVCVCVYAHMCMSVCLSVSVRLYVRADGCVCGVPARRAAAAKAAIEAAAGTTKLHVSNLLPTMDDVALRQLFAPFGALKEAKVEREADGTSKSQGAWPMLACVHAHKHVHVGAKAWTHSDADPLLHLFALAYTRCARWVAAARVVYARPEDAKTALEQMNGFVLVDRALRVGVVTEQVPVVPTFSLPNLVASILGPPPGLAPRVPLPGSALAYGPIPPMATGTAAAATAAAVSKPSGTPSACLVLRHLFDPSEETDADWVRAVHPPIHTHT
jgi:hypothetical protein